MNYTQEYQPLNWNWTSLTDLISKYCISHAVSINATGALPTNMTTGTTLQDVWFKLDFPWAQLNAAAKANSFMILWDKATWKQWLVLYQQVINAFIAYTNNLILGVTAD